MQSETDLPRQVVFQTTPKQREFLDAMCTKRYRHLLYGGAAGGGKRLPLDTPIATPSGWTTMGALRVGDVIFDADGQRTTVTWVSPIEAHPDAWELEFDDGLKIQCDAEHQWVTLTADERQRLLRADVSWRAQRRAKRPSRGLGKRPDLALRNTASAQLTVDVPPLRGTTRTTREIVETLRVRGRANHAVLNAGVLQLPDADLPLGPYTLGAWLGDGCTTSNQLTGIDPEVWQAIEGEGYRISHHADVQSHCIRGILPQLRQLNVLGNKHIPVTYLRGSFEQRLALLQGLCDTDGYCDPSKGSIEFTTTLPALRDGMLELLASLGVKPSCRAGRSMLNGIDHGPKWRIQFWLPWAAFRIPRKLERQKGPVERSTSQQRMIVAACPVAPVPMRCIAVDSHSRTYLAGHAMIPTHNTWVLCAAIMGLCRQFPGSRWAIVRADLPRLKKTILASWNRFAPRPFFEEVNKTDWYVRAANGSEVIFLPASEDVDPNFQRLKSLELNGASIEECDEVSEDYVDVLSSRLGRWKIPGPYQPPILSLYSCNPNQRWPKRRFYDPWRNGTLRTDHFYLPAKITDNPHVSEDYLDQLRKLPEMQRSVFFEGNWENADEPDQLIKNEWVENAFARTPQLTGCEDSLGVDVARYGDDDTVQARTKGWHLVELEAFHGIDTVTTADLAEKSIVLHGIKPHRVRVDTVGLGAGVADTLVRRQHRVAEFIAGAKPIDGAHKFLKFKNLRSQAWWTIRELIKDGPLSFDPGMKPEYRGKLTADLTAPKYSLDSDKVIEVESKDSIKARLGRSTDFGDAVVMAYAKLSPMAGYWAAINTK